MQNNTIKEIITFTNQLQDIQELSGAFLEDNRECATKLLKNIILNIKKITEFNLDYEYIDSLEKDINNMIRSNFEHINFNNSVLCLKIAKQSSHFLFFGPLRLANANRKGWKFEFFISQREEPTSQKFSYMYDKYPHPKNICQSSKLVYSSRGISEGNNIVFFPENVKSNISFDKQNCAVFFFDKFYKIYNEITIPLIKKIGLSNYLKYSEFLTKQENYEARCVWGYLHDYYHHKGNLPFDENISLKTNWYAGVLEEIKVDMQTLITLKYDKQIPYSDATYEFVFFDRLFRYTQEINPSSNFDSATSFFLITYLYKNNVISFNEKYIKFDFDRLPLEINNLVSKIIDIENSFENNSKVYIDKCKELFFSILEKPIQNKKYFSLPEEIRIHLLNIGLCKEQI